MSKNKLIAMKRISKDISEITKNPVKGIGIVQYEDDSMKYIVNIKILNGIYEGYCLQLLLSFSEYYPTKPPKIQIFPNQAFSQTYHHHIFDDNNGFKKFCFDLLDNDFMNINEANTGWNPSYTISSLLLQVQNFLSDPDMSQDHLPNKSQIEYLLNSMNNYVREFVDQDGKVIIHTWLYPYPPMYGVETVETKEKEKESENKIEENKKDGGGGGDSLLTKSLAYISSFFPSLSKGKEGENNEEDHIVINQEDEREIDEAIINIEIKEDKEDNTEKAKNEINEEIKSNENKIIEKTEKEEKEEENKINEIKEDKDKEKEKIREEIKQNLSCFVLRVNIIDDKDIALGYPLKQLKALGDKIECVPIPEILSYEGYISQIAKQDDKLDDYFNVTFKAANNEYYNYWLPIYINEEHFKRNKILILNSFSVLKYGAKGQKEYDFKPEHIFEYLPILLNKMICGMFNQKSYMSEAYIRCYFQYLLLFKKLIEEFQDDFKIYLNNIIDSIKKNKYIVNKRNVPDLGNLFMLLYFSDLDIDNKIWNVLFEEKMLRKMYWTFHFGENSNKCKELFDEYGASIIENSEYNKKFLDLLKKENFYYYEYLEEFKNEKKYTPCGEECMFSLFQKDRPNLDNNEDIKPQKGLFSKMKETNIFEKIVEIIAKEVIKKPKSLNDILLTNQKKTKIDKKTKNQIELRIMSEFPTLYKNECSANAQKKIDQLLLKNIDLMQYCSYDLKDHYDLNKKGTLISSNQVDKLMKGIDKKYHLEITKKLFNISKSNLLLITTLAQMKMNEPGFLKELEDNYGLYIKVEDFIQEINNKLKEIQCYKDLFNFMKADIIDPDEDEYERIIKTYEKAKEKRYIQPSYDELIKGLMLRRAKDFEKNKTINKTNNSSHSRTNHNHINRNNNSGNNNKKAYNKYRNKNNNNNYKKIRNGNDNSGGGDNKKNKKKNNFNSHFVDLDEFLGE